jgi:hypothetical protein
MVVTTSGAAQGIDINLSNDSAMFRYIINLTKKGGLGDTAVDMGFYYTTSDDVMAMAGLQVVNETGTGSPGLDAGVGAKLFALDTDNHNVVSLALGGQLHYSPPAASRAGLMLQAYYSPDIVTFVDGRQFLFFTGRLDYAVTQQAVVYWGYRRVSTELNSRVDIDVESGPHVGVQIAF